MQNPTPPSFLRPSNIYFALALIVFAATVVYGAFQYQILSAEKQAVLDNEMRRAALEEELASARQTFQPFAEERAKAQAEFSKKIIAILPPDENYTDLTRQLDNYFAEQDRPGNNVFQRSLRFSKGAPAEGMNSISILPMNMNIETTRENFFDFLEFINSSGSLESGVRLMEIKSIQLNFPEGGEVLKDLRQKMDVTLDMNAYYQTPK